MDAVTVFMNTHMLVVVPAIMIIFGLTLRLVSCKKTQATETEAEKEDYRSAVQAADSITIAFGLWFCGGLALYI